MRLPASVNMKWHGWVFCGVPILPTWLLCGYVMLMLPSHARLGALACGAVGAAMGFGAVWLNSWIYRSTLNVILKTVLIAAISVAAILLYGVPTVVIDSAVRYG